MPLAQPTLATQGTLADRGTSHGFQPLVSRCSERWTEAGDSRRSRSAAWRQKIRPRAPGSCAGQVWGPALSQSRKEKTVLDAAEPRMGSIWRSTSQRDQVETTQTVRTDWRQLFLPFFFPALGGVLFGYDIGATSGALLSLKDPILSGTSWYDLSATATGLVVSGSLGGALLGSALAFLVTDALGRRRELMLAALVYFVGASLSSSAGSLPLLLSGRLLYGLGIGLAMHAAPMYIAETSPAAVRGTLISLKEAFIVGGILLGFLSGSFFISDVGGWRLIFGASLPFALLMALGMAWLPPSPRWLVLRCAALMPSSGEATQDTAPTGTNPEPDTGLGAAASDPRDPLLPPLAAAAALREQAVESLRRLRGTAMNHDEAEAEVTEMLIAEQSERAKAATDGIPGEESNTDTLSALLSGTGAKALGIASGLVIFQQITGQPSVLYYAASILQDAGFSAASDATKVSVLLGGFKLLMTGVAVLLVDKAGRRPLLIVGISGLVLSLLALGSVYQLQLSAPLLSVAALLLYVGAYQVSFGPISWLMVSEIFPLRIRGRAQSIATLLNFGSNALVTFAFPPLQAQIGQAATFFGFAGIGVVSLLFVVLAVPETKGLTLEQIQTKLQR